MARQATYTFDVVKAAAKGMASRKELREADPKAYGAAQRNGWLEELFGPAAGGRPAGKANGKAKRGRKPKAAAPKAPASEAVETAQVHVSGVRTIEQAKRIMDVADEIGATASIVFESDEFDGGA